MIHLSLPSIRKLFFPMQTRNSTIPINICQSLFSTLNIFLHIVSAWLEYLFSLIKNCYKDRNSVKAALTIPIYLCFSCSVSMAPKNTIFSHVITFFLMHYIRNTLQLIIYTSCFTNKKVSSFGSKKFHIMSHSSVSQCLGR